MTGFEPLIPIATSAIASLATDLVAEEGEKFLRIFSTNVKQQTQQRIYQASGKYVENFKERHGIVKVLGMRQPVDLDSIYTSVQLLDNWDFRNWNTVEELESDFRIHQQINTYLNYENLYSGVEIINSEQFLTVLGGPGSGKTTFLKWVGLEALKSKEGEFKHQCIPVFIELKRFKEDNITFESFIDHIAYEFSICGFPSDPRKFAINALSKGRLLVLLDGLDEVPTSVRNSVIGVIQDLVDRYDKNRFIVSCRVAAYLHNFRRFTDVRVTDFTDEQIHNFMVRWFAQKEEDKINNTADKCWQLLLKPENFNAKELAHTPLLLTFLCLVFDRSQRFSSNRSSLYGKALKILLEDWASEKRIYQEEVYEWLDPGLEEVLLSEIAYTNFVKNNLFFSRQELVGSIKEFLSTNLNIPGHLSGESVLTSIEIQKGILVERVDSLYSFSHLTLQEYLSAKYIHDHNFHDEIVDKHLYDPEWREVFLLVSGLMVSDGADRLLLKINKSLQSLKNCSDQLKLLAGWLERISFHSDHKKTIEKQARNLFVILFIGLDKTVSRARYVDLAVLYCSKLVEKISQLLDGKQPFDNRKNLSHFMQKVNQVGVNINNQKFQESYEISQDIKSEYYKIQKISGKCIYPLLSGLEKTLAKLCDGNLEGDLTKLRARELVVSIIGELSTSEPRVNYLAKKTTKDLIDLIELTKTNAETVVLPPRDSRERYQKLIVSFEKTIENFQELHNHNIFDSDLIKNFIDQIVKMKVEFPKAMDSQVKKEKLYQDLEDAVEGFLCPDSVNISNLFYGMGREFTDYLYAFYILLLCKKQALRVSPNTWEAILVSAINLHQD